MSQVNKFLTPFALAEDRTRDPPQVKQTLPCRHKSWLFLSLPCSTLSRELCTIQLQPWHAPTPGKRGSLVVSALAFSARCHGFDPCGRRGNISVSEHAFLSVICRDGANKCAVLRIGTLTGGSLLKNPTAVYIITCRLSSCKTSVYNLRLLIILERGCSSMYRKKERAGDSRERFLLLHRPRSAVFWAKIVGITTAHGKTQ